MPQAVRLQVQAITPALFAACAPDPRSRAV